MFSTASGAWVAERGVWLRRGRGAGAREVGGGEAEGVGGSGGQAGGGGRGGGQEEARGGGGGGSAYGQRERSMVLNSEGLELLSEMQDKLRAARIEIKRDIVEQFEVRKEVVTSARAHPHR
ncbi:hypothetical protein EJB05_36783 [Eragrostis curvula]|uniref:Uncharacterized protein n=1 Tax=Eragrostis curvula TaxID=38414 RepID=A0A5J9UA17_9POAL|nr:hypothetical protein EJB05_36783 [Eragrostis curvula]